MRGDLIGRVNAEPVGGYGAETLLCIGHGLLLHRPTGWNRFRHLASGLYYRAADAAGNPPYPPAAMTEADIRACYVEDSPRE